MRPSTQRRLDDIYEIIVIAAAEGAPCPSNEKIAEMVGASGPTVCKDFRRLHVTRRIKIENPHRGCRRVLVHATGEWTDVSDLPRAGGRGGRYKSKRTTRRCLKCDDDFPSRGIENRVCDKCKETKSWSSGFAYPVGPDRRRNGEVMA